MSARHRALDAAYGIARSLVVYHANPLKLRRARRLYRTFLSPGDLAFDIGAHVGDRVRAWRAIGAQVVAVEPQDAPRRVLEILYASDPEVVIVPMAVGAAAGAALLRRDPTNPTVASLDQGWIDRRRVDPRFRGTAWSHSQSVAVTTLADLIRRFGTPAFCKIDVEGSEPDVLAGLDRPLPALSFEVLAGERDGAEACVARLESLAAGGNPYSYQFVPGETFVPATPWLDARSLLESIPGLSATAGSGDVYARR